MPFAVLFFCSHSYANQHSEDQQCLIMGATHAVKSNPSVYFKIITHPCSVLCSGVSSVLCTVRKNVFSHFRRQLEHFTVWKQKSVSSLSTKSPYKYLLHVYVEECVFIPSVHFKIMGGPVYSLLPTGHVSNLNGNNAVVVTIALQEMQHLVKS